MTWCRHSRSRPPAGRAGIELETQKKTRPGEHQVQFRFRHEKEEALEEGRLIRRTTTYTSGRKQVREIRMQVVLDRGVWREGGYQPGDGVTREGSFWIAQRDTTRQQLNDLLIRLRLAAIHPVA